MDIAALFSTLLSFIVILTIIVFIHEFGHYLIARLCGVKIETFSIGFGKELFGWNDRRGTRWKFSLLPLGGYVKMFGDATEASTPDAKKLDDMTPEEKSVSFHFQPLRRKAAIVSAGPFANFLLTIAIFAGFIFTNGLSTSEPVLGKVLSGSPAEEAGLRPGDTVLSVDGRKVKHFNDIPRFIATNLGTPVTLAIQRGGAIEEIALTPRIIEEENMLGEKGKRPMLGFTSRVITYEDVGLARALWEAVKRTVDVIFITFEYLGQLIAGERGADELKGPVGIAKLSGQAAEKGITTALWFIAMLSANLGMVNLFPIPPLDGGHLMFYALEGARGRPMAEKFQEYSYRLGFALILTLMAFTIYNDIRQMI